MRRPAPPRAGRGASSPPHGLPGLDPAWSRLVDVPDADGVVRAWHLLDSGTAVSGTLLCLHGNPTWSYLWRGLVAAPPPGWRVVAPDQLGMGYSERLQTPRTLAQRVDDLGRLTTSLGITGPVVTVAHDWGGIISLGWAREHRDQLAGLVLTNTAVHQPGPSRGPLLIRLAHLPVVNEVACVRTPLFVRGTTALSRPSLARDVRDAFAAPYRTAARRRSVGQFVADVPFAEGHPSRAALDQIADDVPTLGVPALLLWGPRDPVFGEAHLRDLQDRLPRAVLHRYEGASHLVPEDAPGYPEVIARWLGGIGESADRRADAPPAEDLPSVLANLTARADDDRPAVVEVGGRSISWAQLGTTVRDIAAGLGAAGVRPGDRVALLVPPSIDLTLALYAVWRAGAVIVVADRGLGLRGMGRALRGARIDHVIGTGQGLAAARAMRLPGTRIAVSALPGAMARGLGVAHTLPGLAQAGLGRADAPDPSGDDEAAVLFTSGATGPAKGVLYRHRQVRAQLALIRSTYALTEHDRMVAAFAPFALYGPALGIASAVPDADVTKPGTLTAAALADAAAAVDATVVFASPAALRNVLATAGELSGDQRLALDRIRLLMSAGAPVPAALLRGMAAVLPVAEPHTPYGMTEALPVTDISLAEIEAAGPGDGICVGLPRPGVRVRLTALGAPDAVDPTLTDAPGRTGEIWIAGDHVKDRYDALWDTEQAAAAHPGWHRSGDVGHFDDAGRLWVEGRVAHVIWTADGPVTPVGPEQRIEAGIGGTVAVVGVGPVGTQQVVVVLDGGAGPLARLSVVDEVRALAGVPIAAVLVIDGLPVDIRHNSKIDRVAVAGWASDVLAGP